ncbi:MAG: hypothetical protein ACTSYA_09445 [Candidatus Kariarchaeaceae archaeon]
MNIEIERLSGERIKEEIAQEKWATAQKILEGLTPQEPLTNYFTEFESRPAIDRFIKLGELLDDNFPTLETTEEQREKLLEQYHIVRAISITDFTNVLKEERIQKTLNKRSTEGWKLVAVIPIHHPQKTDEGLINTMIAIDYYFQK